MRAGGKHYAKGALPPRKRPDTPLYGRIVGPTDVENLAHSNRPARSESLYRLSYPGPL